MAHSEVAHQQYGRPPRKKCLNGFMPSEAVPLNVTVPYVVSTITTMLLMISGRSVIDAVTIPLALLLSVRIALTGSPAVTAAALRRLVGESGVHTVVELL
ncbi:MAG TPA: hypothetical protein VGG05_01025 [Pseudonocardiaceae bacterium]|jgi:hypothetical protein